MFAEPSKAREQNAAQMLRCLRTRSGNNASSPRFHCKNPNIIKRSPPPTSSPITVAEAHGYSCPPNWSARRTQQTAPTKTAVPNKSIFNIFSLNESPRSESLGTVTLRKPKMTKTQAAPIGRFLLLYQIFSSMQRKCSARKEKKIRTARNTISKLLWSSELHLGLVQNRWLHQRHW